jgi:N-acyl-phosphatidylethanolamine-hydrolysing phospholipase D
MDLNTLRALQYQEDRAPPHFVVPLNNEGVLRDMDCDSDSIVIHSLDWWQSRIFNVHLPSNESTKSTVTMSFEITCVPSQHQSNRSINDRNQGLWCGYVVTSVTPVSRNAVFSEVEQSRRITSMVPSDEHEPFSCFFAGDTGYGYVPPGKSQATYVCPAFRDIGDRFDGFDLALLPIGYVWQSCELSIVFYPRITQSV